MPRLVRQPCDAVIGRQDLESQVRWGRWEDGLHLCLRVRQGLDKTDPNWKSNGVSW